MLKRKELVKAAAVLPGFEQSMARVYKSKLSSLVKMGKASGKLNDEQKDIARALRRYLTSEEDREAVRTVLHGLPYTEFGARDHDNRRYLYGITKPIMMGEYRDKSSSKPVATWDMGPYTVFIPEQVLLGGSMELVHLIPMRNSRVHCRHPHHTAMVRDGLGPLDFPAHTCMDQWGPLLVGLCRYVNIPELFRAYYIFLTRYYPGSPLALPESPDMNTFAVKA